MKKSSERALGAAKFLSPWREIGSAPIGNVAYLVCSLSVQRLAEGQANPYDYIELVTARYLSADGRSQWRDASGDLAEMRPTHWMPLPPPPPRTN